MKYLFEGKPLLTGRANFNVDTQSCSAYLRPSPFLKTYSISNLIIMSIIQQHNKGHANKTEFGNHKYR